MSLFNFKKKKEEKATPSDTPTASNPPPTIHPEEQWTAHPPTGNGLHTSQPQLQVAPPPSSPIQSISAIGAQTPSDPVKQDDHGSGSTTKDGIKPSTSTDSTPASQGSQPPTEPSKEQGEATSDPSQVKHEQIDLMTHLTQRSNRVFMVAVGKAKELRNSFIDSEHVLHGLLADTEIYRILTELKVQPQIIEQQLSAVYKKEQSMAMPQVSPRVKRIMDLSLVVARQLGFEFISPEHILVSLMDEGEGAGAQVLKKLGLKKEDLNKKVTGRKEKLGEDEKQKHKSVLAEFTINLTDKALKGKLDPVVERSEVIERVIHILSRRTKNNPCLTGEAGVGKTAIVEGLAQRIAARQVPEPLLEKQILQLDLMSVLAGASHRGEFEQRMKDLIEEVQASQGKIILFIDEIHNIVGAGSSGEGSLDASNFLKPALARGEIQLVGATTLTEYRKYIEKDPALERRFQPVLVPEPTEEAAIKMVKSIKGKYEAFHRVKIGDDAVDEAVKLSKRYVGDRFLPDKAVDLIDEAASAVRLPLISLPEEIQSLEMRVKQLEQEKTEAHTTQDAVKERILNSKLDDIQADLKMKKEEFELRKGQTTTEVKPEVIRDIVSRWTGIPVSKMTESEADKLAKLEDIIHRRMINQEDAVNVIAQAIRRGRAGLKSTVRPIGSFVFLGPTGVGKTELAKTLAEILFGQEEAMVRLDMTEYMEKHEVAKLLGAPPGYVGYEEGGKLTEAVRRRPYTVVLFDEIEKAHPDIFNILLQILDDGRLTDNKGHVVSFKNTVVICTSNIGTKTIQQMMIKMGAVVGNDPQKEDRNKEDTDKAKTNDQQPSAAMTGEKKEERAQSMTVSEVSKEQFAEIKTKVMEELGKFFKPELVNRFDEVIVFEPLSFKHVAEIVKLQMKALTKLLEDQNMGLAYTGNAVEEIARVGYDPIYGARPLRRAIQKLLENPISTLIIKKELAAGDALRIDFDGNDFVFEVSKAKLLTEEPKKPYLCETTNKKFETVVKSNTTVVSPYCGSTKVKPLFETEVQQVKLDDKSQPTPETGTDQKPTNQPTDVPKEMPIAPPATDQSQPMSPTPPVNPPTETKENHEDDGVQTQPVVVH